MISHEIIGDDMQAVRVDRFQRAEGHQIVITLHSGRTLGFWQRKQITHRLEAPGNIWEPACQPLRL